jgi:predicted nucleic acid-binding protein
VNVLVDTPIWSLALRRNRDDLNPSEWQRVAELEEMVSEGRVRVLGPIRQEVLSGIRSKPQFEQLRNVLRAFPDEPLSSNDYEAAAAASNDCRAHGIAASAIDALICAAAVDRGWAIFTSDSDFTRYAKVLHIRLHGSRSD